MRATALRLQNHCRPREALTQRDTSSRRRCSGRLLSWLFHPFVLGLPALVAIGVARQGFRWSLMPSVALAVLVIIGGPTIGTLVLMRLRLVDDLFVSVRRQRVYLYPLLLVSFLGGGLILLRAGVDSLVVIILLSATITLVVAALLTLRIKLSLHCAGIAGIVVGLVAAFGPWWWLTLGPRGRRWAFRPCWLARRPRPASRPTRLARPTPSRWSQRRRRKPARAKAPTRRPPQTPRPRAARLAGPSGCRSATTGTCATGCWSSRSARSARPRSTAARRCAPF